MMKLLHRYIFLALTAFSLGCICSCADDMEVPVPDDPAAPRDGYITLTINSGNITSRATEAGVDDLNENLIQTVTLCLWPSAGDNVEGKPVYMQTFRNLGAKGTAVLHIPLTGELITRLFGEDSSGECQAYAAVNVDPGSATTVEQLRNLAVSSKFDDVKVQSTFTMDGDGTVTLSSTKTAAEGSVTVIRSAAKITLALDVDSEITETTADGEKITWKPNYGGMSVWLVKGVKNSTLVPVPQIFDPEAGIDEKEVYFDTPDKLNYDFGTVEDAEKYKYQQKTPFYTYPNKWSDSPSETHRTYMVLSVPWTPDGGTTYRTCYYQVPVVPLNAYETVRNISYHINLHVGILGSFVPEQPQDIEAEYWVADWGNEDMNVEIGQYRYLVVDQNEFTVNNESSITIPFYTSHATEVIDVKMTFYRYNYSDQGSEFAVTVSKDQNELSKKMGGEPVYECEFDNKTNTLTLTHILDIWQPYHNNNGIGTPVSLTRRVDGSRASVDDPAALAATRAQIDYFVRKPNDSEFSRIEFEVTVQHSDVADGSSGIDKKLYQETVTIMQYPGMYITAVQNYADNLSTAGVTANGALGNTQINRKYTSNTNYPVIQHPEFWKEEIYKQRTLRAITPNVVTQTYSNSTVSNSTQENITEAQWNNWIEKGKKEFFLGFNAQNWNYSLGMQRSANGSYGNWNPNMYLVTVTQLKADTEYVLGDPRSYYINNFLDDRDVNDEHLDTWIGDYYYFQKANGKGPEESTSAVFQGKENPVNEKIDINTNYWWSYVVPGFVSAPALGESSNRRLRYYYPTREDESSQNIIAPKFRICSTYGGSSPYMTRSMSRRRAAAYQEMGYCAGRWRLPTYAEVRFMIDLATEEKIPRLFGGVGTSAWNYWCAQGAVHVPGLQDTAGEVYLDPNPEWGGSDPNDANSRDPQYGGLFTGNNYRDHTRFVYDEWFWGAETLTPSSATPNAYSPTYTFTWGDRRKTNPLPGEN